MNALLTLIIGVAMLLAGMTPATYQTWDANMLDLLPNTQLTIEQTEKMSARELLVYYGQDGFFSEEMLEKLDQAGSAVPTAVTTEITVDEATLLVNKSYDMYVLFTTAESNLADHQKAVDTNTDAAKTEDLAAALEAAKVKYDTALEAYKKAEAAVVAVNAREILDAAYKAELEAIAQAEAEAVAIEAPAEEATTPTLSIMPDDKAFVVTKWFTANIPNEVTTIKVNLTGGWNVPEPASTMLDDEGVLGCDNLADADENASCTWTGGADHQTAQGPVVGLLVPEGSYATAYAASFFVEGGGYTINIPACGTNCAQGLLVRGWHLETHADKNLPITISKYGAIGAMKFTRYPVPAGAGQFFSQDYLTDQAVNALSFDNCGIGMQDDVADCDVFIQHVFDYNDGSYTIMSYTTKDGWKLLWTNIVGYGR